ncbi:NAD(P)/FAD-dependent oxidoreductase [Hymenobacter busanensis]|uniref:NAD(P)/FAD-dependent oxidoreductase n=1 Tax=Hymenobacter busanensis TaxID=2607656 RepID=A0A7L4ZYW8_9BACT|nr:NAD(P)/FAD-dependent oxidoreductase [Hymenobacter busanensis]KAA9333277.1 NAD(P)/FAD-dependent oxidoreductase [Hymenobacter busanensis]QHJ08046.1 FAD-dependent oxidoreductase [Hymenobacter busanensis]
MLAPTPDYDVLIIGGGLAGLTAALDLAGRGHRVALVEKQQYPFHKVCGEYISNEVLPYLARLGASPDALRPARIQRFLVSAPGGRTLTAPLDLGGFGVSRYTLDEFLYRRAEALGVTFFLKTTVASAPFDAATNSFHVQLTGHAAPLTARVVLGAYGKRATLDRQLNRGFFRQRSPYVGVKYHLRLDFPTDLIALHNFADGYAGLSAIENGRYCFCYLTTREQLRRHGTIPALETEVLSQNPHLRRVLREAERLYTQPEVINEISFAPKTCVEQHILMCGDAAGLITPLCGNGMAMAIHGAAVAAHHTDAFLKGHLTRTELEAAYTHDWNRLFAARLRVGRWVQNLFGGPRLTNAVVGTMRHTPSLVQALMRRTHGVPF